ncbi:MAG: PAS domain-containing sensor histidine kinase [Candidatus Margulisiibacteriota bacterium]
MLMVPLRAADALLPGRNPRLEAAQKKLDTRITEIFDLPFELGRLKNIEAMFNSAIESVIEAIILCDSAGTIIKWNRGAEEVFGYARAEILGKPNEILLPERFRQDFSSGVRKFRETGSLSLGGRPREALALRKDRSEFPVEVSFTSLKVSGKEYFLAVARDISERRQLEKEGVMHRAALEAQRQLARITHDLRNLLSGIIGVAELGAGDPYNNPENNFRQIGSQAFVMNDLVDRLLDFSKTIKLSAEHSEISAPLTNLVTNCLSALSETTKSGKEFKLDISEGLWPVRFNAVGLNQILLNLIINAFDATPFGGRVAVVATNERVAAVRPTEFAALLAGNYVKIEVRDTGRGIPLEIRANLFDYGESTKGSQGSGIGLAIVRRMVELHEGYIQVKTAYEDENHGSSFIIYLPAQAI